MSGQQAGAAPAAPAAPPELVAAVARAIAARMHPHQSWDGTGSWWLRQLATEAAQDALAVVGDHQGERLRAAAARATYAEGQLDVERARLAEERGRALQLERALRYAGYKVTPDGFPVLPIDKRPASGA